MKYKDMNKVKKKKTKKKHMKVNILYQIGNERSKTLHSNSYEEEVHEGESVPPADVSDRTYIFLVILLFLPLIGQLGITKQT